MSKQGEEIKFGTDGWRGVISDNFTFSNVRKVARAIAEYYNNLENTGSKNKIAIGYDTRFLSAKYAELVGEVLINNAIDVVLSDRAVPTPTLSFAVKNRGLIAGVMITASHNPSEYNGIKIKTSSGGAAGVEVTGQVENLIVNPLSATASGKGNLQKVDITKEYIQFLRRYIDLKSLKRQRFKILVDPMHGSGDSFIAKILKGSNIKIDFTRADINPSFEGLKPEPVPENLESTRAILKNSKYDICLVLDGDADRIAAFTGGGEFISPQKILGLLMVHLIEDRKMSGDVVKTIVGTQMLDKIAKDFGVKLYETPVGFKYISELMVKEDILLGGEEAGGMGFKGYIPERDGSLAGLLLLEMMAYRKKTIGRILEEVEKKYGRYYYVRDQIKTQSVGLNSDKLKSLKNILNNPVVEIKDSDGIKFVCKDGAWLMLRASGTEPIIRVYAESESLKTAKNMIEFGKKLILK